MTASKGQICEVQITSGRWSLALIAKIVSGDTVNLVALTDAVDPWPTVETPNGLVAGSIASVTKGTSVGQWRDLDLPAATIAAIAAAVGGELGSYATEAYTDAAIAAIPVDDDSGLTVVAVAGSSQLSLGLDSVRQPSATRPTRIDVSGAFNLTSTLLGAQTASVELRSDSSNPPTTVRGKQRGALSGVAASSTLPWSFGYSVPAGHYYKLVSAHSANSSVDLDALNETAG